MNIKVVVEKLMANDDILILCHRSPDGDTIGAAFALHNALKRMGKNARIECADKFGDKFSHITEDVEFNIFCPEYIVAVDVPSKMLLGAKEEEYPLVDLCIDHHVSHNPFAKHIFVEYTAASACEIIYQLICEMCGDVDDFEAKALYTGIATDTGCFKFSNTTAQTHLIAAKLMLKDIDCAMINQKVFSKTKPCALLEAAVLNNANFYYDNKVAIQVVDENMLNEIGANDDDAGILASTLQAIDCVMLGITIREIGNTCRISVRSKGGISSAEFCKKFGGGGHEGAAGCTIEGNSDVAFCKILDEVSKIFEEEEK